MKLAWRRPLRDLLGFVVVRGDSVLSASGVVDGEVGRLMRSDRGVVITDVNCLSVPGPKRPLLPCLVVEGGAVDVVSGIFSMRQRTSDSSSLTNVSKGNI